MPLPEAAKEIPADIAAVQTSIDAVDTAIAGLPATPLEADLPDIVQIISDLSAAATSLRTVVDSIATILATTRVNQ